VLICSGSIMFSLWSWEHAIKLTKGVTISQISLASFRMQSSIGSEDAIQVRGDLIHAITGVNPCHCLCFLRIVHEDIELCMKIVEERWSTRGRCVCVLCKPRRTLFEISS
jgi:hypothetical protein